MSEFIGLTPEELEGIQSQLRETVSVEIQKMIKEMESGSGNSEVDLVSVMAGKDSIALKSALEFTQRVIEANNQKIADMMVSRDTLVLQTALEFTQKAIEANTKKMLEYIDSKLSKE